MDGVEIGMGIGEDVLVLLGRNIGRRICGKRKKEGCALDRLTMLGCVCMQFDVLIRGYCIRLVRECGDEASCVVLISMH